MNSHASIDVLLTCLSVAMVFLALSVHFPSLVRWYLKWRCSKKGHPTVKLRQYYWYDPCEQGVILRRVLVHIDKCYCGAKHKEHVLDEQDYQSVSWPCSYWDELKEYGKLWNKG